eukprot:TRINITY_DN18103_c0_g2_i2.p1 TRINITY_DN18103_c0_g2~~TRINITY_DN18103_c0_g2_i2.p1  ORF type:complete len:934 (+),score=217.94 TRINITY_DN18103_c0_g2_i2:88-2889(+)
MAASGSDADPFGDLRVRRPSAAGDAPPANSGGVPSRAASAGAPGNQPPHRLPPAMIVSPSTEHPKDAVGSTKSAHHTPTMSTHQLAASGSDSGSTHNSGHFNYPSFGATNSTQHDQHWPMSGSPLLVNNPLLRRNQTEGVSSLAAGQDVRDSGRGSMLQLQMSDAADGSSAALLELLAGGPLSLLVVVAVAWTGTDVPLALWRNRESLRPYQAALDLLSWVLLCVDSWRCVALTWRTMRERRERDWSAFCSRDSAVLWCDLVAALPFEIVWIPFMIDGGSELLRVHDALRALRLLKVPRSWQRAVAWGTSATTGIATLIIVWLLHGCTIITIALHDYTEAEDPLSYDAAFYWVVYTTTSVGYGDISVGDAPLVRFYASLLMILGLLGSGLFIGKVADVLSRQDHTSRDIDQRMQELRSLLEFYRIPKDIQTEALAWHAHILQTHAFEHHANVVQGLPPSLQAAVGLCARRRILEVVPVLRGLSDSCLTDLSSGLIRAALEPGDDVVVQGDLAEEIVFITHGELRGVIAENGEERVVRIRDGEVCGLQGVLFGEVHRATFTAVRYTDTLGVSCAMTLSCCVRYPEFYHRLVQIVKDRWFHGVMPDIIPFPDRLESDPRVCEIRSVPIQDAEAIVLEILAEFDLASSETKQEPQSPTKDTVRTSRKVSTDVLPFASRKVSTDVMPFGGGRRPIDAPTPIAPTPASRQRSRKSVASRRSVDTTDDWMFSRQRSSVVGSRHFVCDENDTLGSSGVQAISRYAALLSKAQRRRTSEDDVDLDQQERQISGGSGYTAIQRRRLDHIDRELQQAKERDAKMQGTLDAVHSLLLSLQDKVEKLDKSDKVTGTTISVIRTPEDEAQREPANKTGTGPPSSGGVSLFGVVKALGVAKDRPQKTSSSRNMATLFATDAARSGRRTPDPPAQSGSPANSPRYPTA